MSAADPSFSTRVVEWQRSHGRHTLPWQRTRDPYRVWLSEIMLQQTQVSTVLGYYERFLERFPDVSALAAASIDDVFAMWSGLGYYSRARNLHRCAQAVVGEHGGQFPRSAAQLAELPGIGRSTAAAVAAFCFGERVAILDGNVKRVLSRFLAFDDDLASSASERKLWDHATRLLPDEGIESYTQGLMDLGATVCVTRSPHCLLCPVQADCRARQQDRPEAYPVKTRKLKRGRREHVWLWLQWRDQLWLTQRPDTGVWAGLWSLPEFDSGESFDALAGQWPGAGEALESFTHVLTHLDWRLHPIRWTLPVKAKAEQVTQALPAGRWFTLDEALAAGVPAPLRKLLATS
ncbi:A/G-specific adenine glycosylase [Piscinibacter terrae]|uniref:Adenine DNA glycosylase n=1 Tax=Piscinibacter terrae TaxID=2496871 RepID=A0A3N7HMD1_9BURK|nr:A/G-specific adenine glycosylase [Albitalea terrae]RQP23328.1 A/G-specific adenine glycosylase [Albitalea terrae]